jgi:hypothetical protein
MEPDKPDEVGFNILSSVLFHFPRLITPDFSRSQLAPFPPFSWGQTDFNGIHKKVQQFFAQLGDAIPCPS